MAKIREFSAMYYNPKKYPDTGRLLCLPSSKIDPVKKKELYDSDPYNYVSLVLPEGDADERYRNSIKRIFSWLLRDVVLIDEKPSFYLYEINLKTESGMQVQYALTTLIKLEEDDSIRVLEEPAAAAVEDRYALLKETETHLESVLMASPDNQKQFQGLLAQAAGSAALMQEVKDPYGNTHKVYRLTDENTVNSLKAVLGTLPLYLLEGADKYQAALKLRKEQSNAPETIDGSRPDDYILANIMSLQDSSLRIMPSTLAIRETGATGVAFLKSLEKSFKLGAMAFEDERMEKAARIKLRKMMLENKAQGILSLGVAIKEVPNKYFILSLNPDALTQTKAGIAGSELRKALDILLWNKLLVSDVLKTDLGDTARLSFIRGDNTAIEAVKNGIFDIALIINPIKVMEALKIADNKEKIPHLSADFYPSAMSGLLAYSLKYSKIKG